MITVAHLGDDLWLWGLQPLFLDQTGDRRSEEKASLGHPSPPYFKVDRMSAPPSFIKVETQSPLAWRRSRWDDDDDDDDDDGDDGDDDGDGDEDDDGDDNDDDDVDDDDDDDDDVDDDDGDYDDDDDDDDDNGRKTKDIILQAYGSS